MIEFAPFSAYALLGIGLVLVGLEMALGSFYILWFGIGFCVVSAVEFFYPFANGLHQVALASLIAFVLLVALKQRLKNFLSKNEKEIKDDFLNEAGVGIMKHGMVEFKGTMWEVGTEFKKLEDGVEVEVLKAEKNKATIKLK